jgi:hypothetical protein
MKKTVLLIVFAASVLVAPTLADRIAAHTEIWGPPVLEFLQRNGHPYTYLDVEQDEGARVLVDRFHIGPQDLPVLICRGTKILRAPSNAEVAECLGFNAGIACGREIQRSHDPAVESAHRRRSVIHTSAT